MLRMYPASDRSDTIDADASPDSRLKSSQTDVITNDSSAISICIWARLKAASVRIGCENVVAIFYILFFICILLLETHQGYVPIVHEFFSSSPWLIENIRRPSAKHYALKASEKFVNLFFYSAVSWSVMLLDGAAWRCCLTVLLDGAAWRCCLTVLLDGAAWRCCLAVVLLGRVDWYY